VPCLFYNIDITHMHSLLDIVNPVVRSIERVPHTQHQAVKHELVMITTDCGSNSNM